MKFFYIQFANSMFKYYVTGNKYWDSFYENHNSDGYYRMGKTFEIPKWIAEISFLFPNDEHELFWCNFDIQEAIGAIKNEKPDVVLFSVMDCNLDYVREIIAKSDVTQKFYIGGYTDEIYEIHKQHDNVCVFDTVKDLAMYSAIEYKQGTNYALFNGEHVIPRLTLSYGCKNNCKFCIVPKQLTIVSDEIIYQQIDSFKDLNFKLIYLDDKTFGQADNYLILKDLRQRILSYNPDFLGFIVQTTCFELIKKAEIFKEIGVKVVEIGVESYNDFILREYNKASTLKLVDESIKIGLQHELEIIPNFIVGFTEETEETYNNTIEFMCKCVDLFYGMNISIYTNYGRKHSKGEIEFIDSDKIELHRRFFDEFNNLGIVVSKNNRAIKS